MRKRFSLSQKAKVLGREMRSELARIVNNMRSARLLPRKKIAEAGTIAVKALKAAESMNAPKKRFIIRQAEEWAGKKIVLLHKREAVLRHFIALLTDTPNLKVKPTSKWKFPDEQVVYGNFFVFGTKKQNFGLLLIDHIVEKPYFLINALQGIRGMNPKAIQRELGKPWFEAIMGHFIASCKPLAKAGIKFGLRAFRDYKTGIWAHRKYPVYHHLLDRYFSRELVTDKHPYPISYYPVNPKKKRVKALLGLK